MNRQKIEGSLRMALTLDSDELIDTINRVVDIVTNKTILKKDYPMRPTLNVKISGVTNDFTISILNDNYRFIHKDYIDEIQQRELLDSRILGKMNPDILGQALNCPTDSIEFMQDLGIFDELGHVLIGANEISKGAIIKKIQKVYVADWCYGRFFVRVSGDINNDYGIVDGAPYWFFKTS